MTSVEENREYWKDWKGPKARVFYVFDNPEFVGRWLLGNTLFDETELNSFEFYNLGNEHLRLLLENGEDPTIVKYVWGMSPRQLDYFRRFEPTQLGHRELMSLGARWIEQAEQLGGIEEDAEFLKRRRDEAVLDSARARAYWVLSERDRAQELWRVGADSRSPEFEDFYSELERAA
jgi:hypothetical protein